MIWVYEITIFIYIILFNFQDLFLKKFIGNIGASGILLMTPITVLILGYSLVKIRINRFDKQLIFYIVYMILLSIITSMILGINNGIWNFYNQSLLLKSFKLVVYNIVGFFSIIVYSKVFTKISENKIRNIININYLFIICYSIYESIYNNGRIKLLTSEPSEAGFILGIFLLLGLFYNKKIMRVFYVISFIILSLNISSKGTILCMFLSIVILLVSKIKLKKIITTILLIMILVLIFKYFYLEILKNAIINDLVYFSSIVTRGTTILATKNVFFNNIFGVAGNYLYFLPKEGYEVYNNLKRIYPSLNYSEIVYYLETGENFTPKSGLLMDLLLYGVYAIYFYVWTFKYFWINLKDSLLLLVLILFTYISMLTYVDKYMTPTYILVFTILQSLIIKKQKVEV